MKGRQRKDRGHPWPLKKRTTGGNSMNTLLSITLLIMSQVVVPSLAQVVPTIAVVDTSAITLPPNYQGTDIRALYRKLAIPPKGEFETTQAYQERAAKVPTGIWAFVIEGSEEYPLKWVYNADQSTFFVRIFTRDSGVVSGKIDVKQISKYEGQYVGTNALGVSKTIKKYLNKTWSILFDGELPGYYYTVVDMAILIKPERAPAMKERLSVLVVCQTGMASIPGERTSSDSLAVRQMYKEPTIDSPYEITSYFYEIPHTKVLAFWVFDKKTGEILCKLDPYDGSDSSGPKLPITW